MRATVFHAKGDVRVENVPGPKLRNPSGRGNRAGGPPRIGPRLSGGLANLSGALESWSNSGSCPRNPLTRLNGNKPR